MTTTTNVATTSTVTATTSTLAPANGPDIPGVATGEAGATIGGSQVTVKVEARDNSLVVTVGDATVSYSVKDKTGAQRGVSAASALTFQPGDTLTVGFAGFGKGYIARSWLLPGGTPLGETRLADGSGSIVSVLADTTPAGEHRIVAEAASKDGKPVVVAYGVRVAESGSSRSPWSVVFLVIVGLGVVLGLLIPAARRRREEEEDLA